MGAAVVTDEQLHTAFGAYEPPLNIRLISSAPPANLRSILRTRGPASGQKNIRFASQLVRIKYIENRDDIAAEEAAQAAELQRQRAELSRQTATVTAGLHSTGAAVEPDDGRLDDVATTALFAAVRDVGSMASAQRQRSMQLIRDPQSNPTNCIVDAITGWDAGWLERMTDEPNVNGANYAPVAMLHNYCDFQMYLK